MTGQPSDGPGAALGRHRTGGNGKQTLEDLKRASPPAIVRFPESGSLVAWDRWVTLQLMSIPWGPLAVALFVPAHFFTAPLHALGGVFCLVLTLEGDWPVNCVGAVLSLVSLVPMALLVLKKVQHTFFFTDIHVPLSNLAVFLLVWATNRNAFEACCLYATGWVYTLLLVMIIKQYSGRRRPAVVMREQICKLPRMAIWEQFIEKHADINSGAHESFPSGDAAAAASLVGALYSVHGWVPWPALLLAALAAYGRLYFFAHHLLDVLVGVAIGFACTVLFAASLGTSQAYHWLLVWSLLCIGTLARLVLVGPLACLPAFALCAVFGLCAGCSFLIVGSYLLLAVLSYAAFVKHSTDLKPWVMQVLEEYFAQLRDPELPQALCETLATKRANLREQAARPGAFPGNVYLLFTYCPGECRFAADWEDIARLMALRLEDFARQTGLALESVDVVLGIYTGGALLAPLVASKLGHSSCCYIRVKRYQEDVLGIGGSMRTMLQKVSGQHEKLYSVSDGPEESALSGKTVLMVDDAVGSGGTFRAAHGFCMKAGARAAKGVALDAMKPGRHIWDPSLPQPEPQDLQIPCFTPWGLR